MNHYIKDDDYVISDRTRGGYTVNHGIGHCFSFDGAISAILEDMDCKQFFPSIWFVNDHGNVDLLSVNASTGKYEVLESYV